MKISMQKFGKLRSIKTEELEIILCWRNSPGVRNNMYTQHEITLSEHQNWWKSVEKNKTQQYFMYELKGVALGVVSFNKINAQSKNSSWAFYASPEATRGTGSKMEFLALDYAFEQLKLHRLYCEVLCFNSSVIKLHEKFGFKVEGILREHHRVNDKYVDVSQLGILSREWSSQRQQMLKKLDRIS